MHEPQLDAAGILRRFREGDVHVVLIGGMAAIALGVPYLTQDIDFCYDSSPEENCAGLVAALASLQPRLRVEGLPDEVARELPWQWDTRALRDAPNLTLQTDAGPIDLWSEVAGLGGYRELLPEAVILEIDGQDFAVLDLPGLMRAKRATGRAKDEAMLPLLEATLLLREQRRRAQINESEEGPA